MFLAIDIKGNRVFIDDAKRGVNYYCPDCNTQLIVKKGPKKIHHFAHKCELENNKRECAYHSRKNKMTDWHKGWQGFFSKECVEYILEYNGKKRIADVLINNVVFEFQHSDITLNEFRDRNIFYNSLGYKVIWIFDMIKEFKENSITKNVYSTNNEYEWPFPKKLFKEINLETENCDLYFDFNGNFNFNELCKVISYYKGFRYFFGDFYGINIDNLYEYKINPAKEYVKHELKKEVTDEYNNYGKSQSFTYNVNLIEKKKDIRKEITVVSKMIGYQCDHCNKREIYKFKSDNAVFLACAACGCLHNDK